jgi:hypothetical protein
MELMIPGLILVALMVYASTRIKRIAAEAFEAETIETEEFTIRKPEGFLNVANGDPRYAFEAYSRDYGPAGDKDARAATAKLSISDGTSLTDAIETMNPLEIEVSNELTEVIGEIRYRVIEGKRVDGDAVYRVLFKAAERKKKTYVLEVSALETAPETMRKAEALRDSFELK